MKNQDMDNTERVQVLDLEVSVCPGCKTKPPKGPIAADVMAPCKNDSCRVNSFDPYLVNTEGDQS
jgi:hypothetical protein